MNHRLTIALPLLLSIALPVPGAATLSMASTATSTPSSGDGFRLPQPTVTPTQGTSVQGPVDDSGPVPVAPQPIGRPTPSPTPAPVTPSTSASGLAPNSTTQPTTQATTQSGGRDPVQSQTQPQTQSATTTQQASGQVQEAAGRDSDDSDSEPGATSANSANQSPSQPDPQAGAATSNGLQGTDGISKTTDSQGLTGNSDSDSSIWWWLIIGLFLLMAGGAFAFWKRRSAVPALPAPIAKPKPASDDQADPAEETPDQTEQSDQAAPSEQVEPPEQVEHSEQGAQADQLEQTSEAPAPLSVEVQALTLGRSFANITLTYAITLTNMNDEAIDALNIEADVTTAHGNVPVENQVTVQKTALPPLIEIAQLPSGSAKQARGEFRLPISELRVIRQGKTQLYIPLLRLKVSAAGMDPIVQTYVVGQRQPGISTRLLPFRLDEAAQTYRNIAVRTL